MKYFADLYTKGNETISERKEVLLKHSITLDAQKNSLDKCSKILAEKLHLYEKILGEKL